MRAARRRPARIARQKVTARRRPAQPGPGQRQHRAGGSRPPAGRRTARGRTTRPGWSAAAGRAGRTPGERRRQPSRPAESASNPAAAAGSVPDRQGGPPGQVGAAGPKPVPARCRAAWRTVPRAAGAAARRSAAIRQQTAGSAGGGIRHTCRVTVRHAIAAHATSAGRPAVTRTSSAYVVGKTACGMPPAAQTSSYCASAVSTRVRSGAGWPSGATPPIGWPVCSRTNSGVARRSAVDADQGGHLGGVDPVRAGGQHQQRRAVGVEDQRVGDLADLDAERGGGRGGGGDRVGQHADLAHGRRPRLEGVLDRPDVGVHRPHLAARSGRRDLGGQVGRYGWGRRARVGGRVRSYSGGPVGAARGCGCRGRGCGARVSAR